MQSSTSRTFLTKSKGYNREDFIQGQTQSKSDIKHTLLIIGQNPRFIKNKEFNTFKLFRHCKNGTYMTKNNNIGLKR